MTLAQPKPTRAPIARALLAAASLGFAALLAGCAGSGAVAPVSTASTASGTGAASADSNGYPEIGAVQSAIGGDWTGVHELPHSVCTPEGGAADSGMQNILTTTSATPRSAGDAREAARLAGEALAGIGLQAGEPTEIDGGASVSATGASGTTVVTVDGTTATIELRTPCFSSGDPQQTA